MTTLTTERVLQLLDYDPECGTFRWRARPRPAGELAGCINKDGYRKIEIDVRKYLVHRLVWFIETGKWPSKEIDHINGIRDDNRFVNLREATRYEQNRNSRVRVTNKAGVKGVCWKPKIKKWIAQIRIDGRVTHLGCFTNINDAAEAYRSAALKHYGEFAHC